MNKELYIIKEVEEENDSIQSSVQLKKNNNIIKVKINNNIDSKKLINKQNLSLINKQDLFLINKQNLSLINKQGLLEINNSKKINNFRLILQKLNINNINQKLKNCK